MSAPSDTDTTLEEWCALTQERRDELDAFALSPLPVDVSERHAAIEKAIHCSDDSGKLLADAEQYLTHERAKALLAVASEFEDFSAKEREMMVKDRIRNIQRLVDGLTVTNKTIQHRIFQVLNANRSRL